jgi:cytochrome c-type biogenesis protein CcmH/NrfF
MVKGVTMDQDDRTRASAILDQVNCLSCNEQHIGFEIAESHPTLQQSFMRVVVGFLQAEAAKTYSDARNDATRALAKRLLTAVTEDELSLPLI